MCGEEYLWAMLNEKPASAVQDREFRAFNVNLEHIRDRAFAGSDQIVQIGSADEQVAARRQLAHTRVAGLLKARRS